jgi:3-deoxy-D-manno-octulosonic-acid transferase
VPRDTVGLAARAYDLAFGLALPFLRRNRRLADGWDQRILAAAPPRADVWLQAASAGEALLAVEILKRLGPAVFGAPGEPDTPPAPLTVLATSGTRQGLDILAKAAKHGEGIDPRLDLRTAFFPLDRPRIMEKAVAVVAPRVMALVEAEIWPGLLTALARAGTPAFILNGRITTRSLARYLLWPGLWRTLAPALVQAISSDDAARFGLLFGPERVEVMPNIKFDRIAPAPPLPREKNPLATLVPASAPFVALASVREEEEDQVAAILATVRERRPEAVIGVFPRHMHRLSAWRARLAESAPGWAERSRLTGEAAPGTVVLWDVFGEMTPALALARAAFVGGSLAPLGGQNFLEALECGLVPVVGPYWENFAWVGRDIVDRGLLLVARDADEAAALLLDRLDAPESREAVAARVQAHFAPRRGGAEGACRRIAERLKGGYRPGGPGGHP